ncbi:SCAMP family protein [Dictyocaulus viviparus]|uniref:Secretory carrier-associated membrane protein n=1 Tax=Dictyocaulus viviparus TaxID=29172 RepID=A0A0D8Y876_DICVI|nr:SCAMP family protein [Dictyocaulus viviparus]
MALNSNPFADPFADPAVRDAINSGVGATDATEDFNPFANKGKTATVPTHQGFGGPSVPMSDELFRKQEELERKAQELRQREEELNRRQQQQQQINSGVSGNASQRPHNWPPLPSFIPIEPCFYQDIEVEIPVQFQKTVTVVYYVFLMYVLALSVNVVASLFYMLFAGGPIGQLLLAVIQLCLFSPCSFLFWFRPVYKAFRNDSSFNFMVFFFVLFFHSLFTLVQTLGVSSYACGWINTIETFSGHFSIPVALVMLLSASSFTAALCGMVYALLRVHKLYRLIFTNFYLGEDDIKQFGDPASQSTKPVRNSQTVSWQTEMLGRLLALRQQRQQEQHSSKLPKDVFETIKTSGRLLYWSKSCANTWSTIISRYPLQSFLCRFFSSSICFFRIAFVLYNLYYPSLKCGSYVTISRRFNQIC